MYNTDLPRRAELPTSAQLKRSTGIASAIAAAILVLVVLPSEYAIDPTGVGRMLGLTEMGEIKTQLAQEAAQDAAATAAATPTGVGAATDQAVIARLDRIETVLRDLGRGISTGSIAASAPQGEEPMVNSVSEVIAEPDPVVEQPAEDRFAALSVTPAGETWQDELSFDLPPGEGVEVKMVMREGEQAQFHWTANGSVVNYDTHGDGGGNSVSYEKGRSVPEQAGALQAAFTGNHGWFWRNRTGDPVTLTVRTRGAYSDIKQVR